jgi:hypothetical protein
MSKVIKVEYKVYASSYAIRNNLPKLLRNNDILAFDTETRSVYSKPEIAEAKEYLKDAHTSDPYYKQARVVSESSGLSFGTIAQTTHFIFSENANISHIFISTTPEIETYLWEQVVNYAGKLLIHNALFDLKLGYIRTGKIPKNYFDTMLSVKCLINSVDIWKAKTSLKELVGEYYPPSWSLYNEYNVDNLKDKSFLKYMAYDTSAVWTLYKMIQEEYKNYLN